MARYEYVTATSSQLLLNVKNPRFEDEQESQRDAMQKILSDKDEKLFKLAGDIARKGLNPGKRMFVRRNGQRKNSYIVLDGNRRITAIKLLSEPALLDSLEMPKKLSERFKKLHPHEPLGDIDCAVMTEEDAQHWLKIEHIPGQPGSTEPWDTPSRHRYIGDTPQLTARDLVRDSGYLEADTKARIDDFPLSNIERFLGTKYVSEKLGLAIRKGVLTFTGEREEAIQKLSALISKIIDMKHTVSDFKKVDARVAYIDEVLSEPLPIKQNGDKKSKPKPRPVKKTQPKLSERKALIPTDCVLNIQHPRLSRVYQDLLRLSVDEYPNSVAVLLRVFVELSVDHYGKQKGLKFEKLGKARKCTSCHKALAAPKLDMTFREKIHEVADFMQTSNILNKNEVFGIKKLADGQVVDLNAYIHNKDYNPKASELRLFFDDIRLFVEQLWK